MDDKKMRAHFVKLSGHAWDGNFADFVDEFLTLTEHEEDIVMMEWNKALEAAKRIKYKRVQWKDIVKKQDEGANG